MEENNRRSPEKHDGTYRKESDKNKTSIKCGRKESLNKWIHRATGILAYRNATDPLGFIVQEEGTTLLPLPMTFLCEKIEKNGKKL